MKSAFERYVDAHYCAMKIGNAYVLYKFGGIIACPVVSYLVKSPLLVFYFLHSRCHSLGKNHLYKHIF